MANDRQWAFLPGILNLFLRLFKFLALSLRNMVLYKIACSAAGFSNLVAWAEQFVCPALC